MSNSLAIATGILGTICGFLLARCLAGIRQGRDLARSRREQDSPPDFVSQLDACRGAERRGVTARERAVTARGGVVNLFD